MGFAECLLSTGVQPWSITTWKGRIQLNPQPIQQPHANWDRRAPPSPTTLVGLYANSTRILPKELGTPQPSIQVQAAFCGMNHRQGESVASSSLRRSQCTRGQYSKTPAQEKYPQRRGQTCYDVRSQGYVPVSLITIFTWCATLIWAASRQAGASVDPMDAALP